jgi:hypothetical protein
MSKSDKATRSKAAPFEGLPFNSGGQFTGGSNPVTNTNDIYRLSGANAALLLTSNIVPIRITQLEKGDTVESYFTINLTAANASGFSVRVGIGTFSDQLNLTANTVYDEGYINTSHQRIFGTTTKFTVAAGGTLSIIDQNILPAMYDYTSDEYVSDAFVLLMVFDSIPAQTAGWSLNTFKVVCSAQIAVGV